MFALLRRMLGRRYTEPPTCEECPNKQAESTRQTEMADELQEISLRLEQLDYEADVLARRQRGH